MHPPYFFFEGETMTLQIAIEARDGFVLASDLKTITTGNPGFIKPGTVANYPMYEPKITVNEKHAIAIAQAGSTAFGAANESDVLNQELQKLEQVPEAFSRWLEEWSNAYVERNNSAGSSLLIVHPTAKESINRIIALPFWDRPCKANTRWPWALHANQLSPATFWPQLFKCDQKPQMPRAIKIAAMTILMAGALHNNGVGKLEVYHFKEKWTRLSEEEVTQLENRSLSIMDEIEKFVNG